MQMPSIRFRSHEWCTGLDAISSTSGDVVMQVSDTVVEPYNATLSVHQLVENADECMVRSYP